MVHMTSLHEEYPDYVLVDVYKRQAFTSYFPRFDEKGQLCGVFLYVIVHGMEDAQSLTRRIGELSSAVEYYRQELSRERGARYGLDNIIGKSAAIVRLKEQILHCLLYTSRFPAGRVGEQGHRLQGQVMEQPHLPQFGRPTVEGGGEVSGQQRSAGQIEGVARLDPGGFFIRGSALAAVFFLEHGNTPL